MSRKDVYSKIEKMEGGEAIRDALKALFQADDTKLQESIDANGTLKTEMGDLRTSIDDLKASNENTVPKTEMEKAIADMQKTLGDITTERDEIKVANEKNVIEKKNGEINSHFSKAVLDSFGSKNAEMAVGFAMSNGSINYNDDGEMGYNGKIGDDAIESFKTDNSHLVQNRGTGTSGGNNSSTDTSYVDSLRKQMLRD